MNAREAFSLFFSSSSSSSDPKNVSRFLGLFGNEGTGHPHGSLDVLVEQGFLGAFVDFLLDHLLRFSFDTACQPRFQALKSVTGGFQGISGPFKPAETASHHLHHHPFAILIVFVGSKSRQTAPDHADGSRHSIHWFDGEQVWSLFLYSPSAHIKVHHRRCDICHLIP